MSLNNRSVTSNTLRERQNISCHEERLFVCLIVVVFFAAGCKQPAVLCLVVQQHVMEVWGTENKDVKNGHSAWTFEHESEQEKNNSMLFLLQQGQCVRRLALFSQLFSTTPRRQPSRPGRKSRAYHLWKLPFSPG